jgi:hypothetical protein
MHPTLGVPASPEIGGWQGCPQENMYVLISIIFLSFWLWHGSSQFRRIDAAHPTFRAVFIGTWPRIYAPARYLCRHLAIDAATDTFIPPRLGSRVQAMLFGSKAFLRHNDRTLFGIALKKMKTGPNKCPELGRCCRSPESYQHRPPHAQANT